MLRLKCWFLFKYYTGAKCNAFLTVYCLCFLCAWACAYVHACSVHNERIHTCASCLVFLFGYVRFAITSPSLSPTWTKWKHRFKSITHQRSQWEHKQNRLIGEWWKAPRLTWAINNSAAVTEDSVWHKGSNDIHLALPATKYNCSVLADACCGGGFTLGGEVSGRSGRRFVHVVRKSVRIWHEFFNILYFGYRYLADNLFRGTSDEWAARIKCLCRDSTETPTAYLTVCW